VVIHNLLSPFKKKFTSHHFAWVTYTQPEIATFGISEKDSQNLGYEKIVVSTTEDDRAVIENSSPGFVCLYLDKKSRIKGGTIVSDFASEISHELILAMHSGLPISTLFKRVHPYPSRSRITRKIAGMYLEKSLTPFIKKVLLTLFRF